MMTSRATQEQNLGNPLKWVFEIPSLQLKEYQSYNNETWKINGMFKSIELWRHKR